jgi:hypothetical protein
VEKRVNRFSRTRVAGWLLACVLPACDVETTLGDLEEEHAFRGEDSFWWYWSQIVRSIPTSAWASIRRGGLASTCVAAIAACATQATFELGLKAAITALTPYTTAIGIASLAVTIPSFVLLSYGASRVRPGAGMLMALLVLIAVAIQLTVRVGGELPVWTRLAALLLGTSAALTGGALSLRRQRRG